MSNGVVVVPSSLYPRTWMFRVACAAVREAVDEPRVAVVREDDRLVRGEERVEVAVGEPVRVLLRVLQPHEVDDVDDTDLELRQVLTQEVRSRQDLERRDVARTAEHDVRVLARYLGARPLPDPEATGAVRDSLVHGEEVRRRLLARDDHVDVVPAAQAVVVRAEKGVGVRRKVDAHDLGLLVHDMVDEPGVLVREAVVVLAPDVAREQVVQRRDRPAPRDLAGDLEPLGVLVEHRVDDVDERLVAVEHAVASGEEVPLEPSLALVLGEHLDDPARTGEVVVGVAGQVAGVPDLVGRVEDSLEAVGRGLVRTEDPEVVRVETE